MVRSSRDALAASSNCPIHRSAFACAVPPARVTLSSPSSSPLVPGIRYVAIRIELGLGATRQVGGAVQAIAAGSSLGATPNVEACGLAEAMAGWSGGRAGKGSMLVAIATAGKGAVTEGRSV